MKTIYELGLHEEETIGNYVVCRVPGGWIYTDRTMTVSPVFVPFNPEFQEKESAPALDKVLSDNEYANSSVSESPYPPKEDAIFCAADEVCNDQLLISECQDFISALKRKGFELKRVDK